MNLQPCRLNWFALHTTVAVLLTIVSLVNAGTAWAVELKVGSFALTRRRPLVRRFAWHSFPRRRERTIR